MPPEGNRAPPRLGGRRGARADRRGERHAAGPRQCCVARPCQRHSHGASSGGARSVGAGDANDARSVAPRSARLVVESRGRGRCRRCRGRGDCVHPACAATCGRRRPTCGGIRTLAGTGRATAAAIRDGADSATSQRRASKHPGGGGAARCAGGRPAGASPVAVRSSSHHASTGAPGGGGDTRCRGCQGLTSARAQPGSNSGPCAHPPSIDRPERWVHLQEMNR